MVTHSEIRLADITVSLLLDAVVATRRYFKRSSLLGRLIARMASAVARVRSSDTVDIVAGFNEPLGNLRGALFLVAAIIIAWLAIVWNICRSLSWLSISAVNRHREIT
jgi:hypothetical protein